MPGLEDLTEVGRLTFRGQFKAGMDESHREFVVDNDSRETYESWEACIAEGVRERRVDVEVPASIQKLHEQSLTTGRDVLEEADPEEKRKWLAKNGEDWSGAFGHDPKAYMDSRGKRRAEPGKEDPIHDPYNPSSGDDDDDNESSEAEGKDAANPMAGGTSALDFFTMDAEHKKDSEKDHGARGVSNGNSESPQDKKNVNAANNRTEKRKHRGLMQWKPVRNAQFAKDEAKFAFRRVKNKMTALDGREPDVETETG